MVQIESIDHLVFTVKNINDTCRFYSEILGMKVKTFNNGRTALHFGKQKINLHEQGKELSPNAKLPTPGSEDLCLVTKMPIEEVKDWLVANNIKIEEGPIDRTGAVGPIRSVYVRDPDENLIELTNYI